MKRRIARLTALIVLSCAVSAQASPKGKRIDLQVKEPAEMKICHSTQKTSCVSPGDAMSALYNSDGYEALDNVAVIANIGIVSTVAAARYSDVKDSYAIFITQLNRFNKGTIDTCHACSPVAGVVIYQYRNGWKLFAKNSAIGELGRWGRAMGHSSPVKDLKVIPGRAEDFLIALNGSYGNQGHENRFVNIIHVSPSALSNYAPSIRYIGSIYTGQSSCGTGQAGSSYWDGDVSYSWNSSPPIATVVKRERDCDSQAFIRATESTAYQYNGREYVKRK